MKRPSKPAEDLITVNDFYRLVPDGQKADLLDGVIYMASPDSIRSNDLTGFIDFLFRGYNSARNLGGRVFVNRVAYRLTRYHAPEPDVGFVRPERVHLIAKNGVKGSPSVAVEVVSRESRARDYGRKKRTYEKAGVEEYWIIDPLKNRVELHQLKDGRFVPVPLGADQRFYSQVISGFWLDVRWLLADPLPNEYQCLQQILQS